MPDFNKVYILFNTFATLFVDITRLLDTVDFYSEIAMPLDSTAECAEARRGMKTVSELCALRGGKSLDFQTVPAFSVQDLNAHFIGSRYVREILKLLPQKPDPILIQERGCGYRKSAVLMLVDGEGIDYWLLSVKR